MTQSGTITFFSESPLENIEAVNNQVSTVMNLTTGEIQAQLLVKAFEFDKALMKRHFNERYLESHKYPKSKFVGKIVTEEALNLSESPQNVSLEGSLSLHGVTRDLTTNAAISKTADGIIQATSTFFVNLEEYNVEVPSGVRKKVAEDIKVTITVDLEEIIE